MLTHLICLFYLFFVFSLGLNLGLYGVISFDGWHQTSGKDHSRGIFQKHDVQQPKSATLSDYEFVGDGELVKQEIQGTQESKRPKSEYQEGQMIEAPVDPIQFDTSILAALTSHEYKIPTPLKAVVISAEKRYDAMDLGPIEAYLQQGGRIPVALLTCNRAKSLEQTIESLLTVRGIHKSDVIIFQDGNLEAISKIGKKHGIETIQNVQKVHLRGRLMDGAARIAQHYKFSLSMVFKMRPSAPACIIVEDDLLFSPDFFDYFRGIAPLIDKDPTVFIASAWNDNGFTEKVRDIHGLRRTEFFPGLGWLLSRELYIGELESSWPTEHWDHWLRSDSVSKGREIVYPQVPRSFHNGVIGTFMNVETHNKYFKDIAYNRNVDVVWSTRAYLQGVGDVYEQRIKELIDQCIHVESVNDLSSGRGIGKVHCAWINVNPDPSFNGFQEFEQVGKFFGLWHEHQRGVHRGVHEFYWKNRYVLILNIFESASRRDGEVYEGPAKNYKSLMPSSARVIARSEFM